MSDAAAPTFRRAALPAIVRLLADDALGATRETVSDPLPASYGAAFDEIDRDPDQELVVVALPGRPVAGVMQLTSDKQRPHAIRFYASLGFVAPHEGMKLRIEPVSAPGSAAPAAP